MDAVAPAMELFVVAVHAALTEVQRAYLHDVLATVSKEFLVELGDPTFRQWIEGEMPLGPRP